MNIYQLLQQRWLKEKNPADANLKEQKLNQGMNYSLQTSYIKNVFEILQIMLLNYKGIMIYATNTSV